MNLLTAPLLKPLFTAITRLPLIGPHAGYEVPLLKSGAKTAAYVHPGQLQELQADIDAGRLIRRDVPRTLPHTTAIYSWPEVNLDDVMASFEYLKKKAWSNDIAPDLTSAFNRASKESGLAMTYTYMPRDKLPAIDKAAINVLNRLPQVVQNRLWIPYKISCHISRSNAAEFLNGERRALIVQDFTSGIAFGGRDNPLRARHRELLADGTLRQTSHTVSISDTMTIVAQPDQEQAVEDLAKILPEYFSTAPEHGLPPDREGVALGYSDADIDLWLRQPEIIRQMSPLVRFAMAHTNGIRRDLRCALMKEAGPNWSRNP